MARSISKETSSVLHVITQYCLKNTLFMKIKSFVVCAMSKTKRFAMDASNQLKVTTFMLLTSTIWKNVSNVALVSNKLKLLNMVKKIIHLSVLTVLKKKQILKLKSQQISLSFKLHHLWWNNHTEDTEVVQIIRVCKHMMDLRNFQQFWEEVLLHHSKWVILNHRIKILENHNMLERII